MKDILAALAIILILACIIYGVRMNVQCASACGTDPVNKCYEDRVVCVGTDKLYVKTIK